MPEDPVFGRRRMGVLLHPSSLPGPHGIGDIGPEARNFVDWLASAGATVWQMLPTCPPGGPRSDIPYVSWASQASDPHLISLVDLVTDGLLEAHEAEPCELYDEGWAHRERAGAAKNARLTLAVNRLKTRPKLARELEVFRESAQWALPAARFAARARHTSGAPWWQWPAPLQSHAPDDLARTDRALAEDIDQFVGRSFLYERQWSRLRSYAQARGVRLLGDVPIYVDRQSADVWMYPDGWQIDGQGRLENVSGAPPDVFSADGQLWGGPLYDWQRMADDDFKWWRSRLKRAFEHFDSVRIDHFRALSAYWSIPATATSAREGRWVEGPGLAFFDALKRHLGPLSLCAEDLGTIDDDVRALLAATGIAGMKVLHYAFGENSANPYLPHNIPEHAVVYPGNHDNNTTVGWWARLSDSARTHAQHYLGVHGHDIAWDLNRAALASSAQLAVIQMQDLLSLDERARMNDPTSYVRPVSEWRNWRWRLKSGEAHPGVAERLGLLGELYGRVPALRTD